MSQSIPLVQLRVSDNNVRKSSEETKNDETNLSTLTANINQYGLLNPLTVCKSFHTPDMYDIVAGQRRFKAISTLGWESVPCHVVECKDAEQAELISLAENMQRLPMTIKDKCAMFQRLYQLHDENLDEISKMTNLSATTLKRYLKLSDSLSASLHAQLDEKGDNKLTLDVANLLTKTIPDQKEQEAVYEAIKDLPTNKQKKQVIEALGEEPEANVNEIVEEIRAQDAEHKKFAKIKNKPWLFDEKEEPFSIPKKLQKSTLQYIRQQTK